MPDRTETPLDALFTRPKRQTLDVRELRAEYDKLVDGIQTVVVHMNDAESWTDEMMKDVFYRLSKLANDSPSYPDA